MCEIAVYVLSTIDFVSPEEKIIRKEIMQEFVDVNGDYYCVAYKQVPVKLRELLRLQATFGELLVYENLLCEDLPSLHSRPPSRAGGEI